MWNRKELKAKGKAAFRANYWRCVVVALILTLIIGGTAGSAKSRVDQVSGTSGASSQLTEEFNNLSEEDQRIVVKIVVGGLTGIAAISFLGRLLIFNPLTVGCKRFFVVNSNAPAELGELLYGFKKGYGGMVVGMFMRDVFVALWSVLFIVPGIIKSLSYRMVPYILAEEPGISGMEAIKRSKQMMNGHKMNTFLLDLSFFGWFLLSVFSLGIVNTLWTEPYVEATGAELYKTLKNA